ncbi:penicillin-binding transpeptidase domain-containing protein, partial [Streptomyces sp. NPDC006422]|uniref:penicillin-binding transpeptidase domain-containing protein n=1 Tax=Streptomyces sp. NPDC006422 TaxID=3155457 RepID=UPI0033AFDD23
KADAGSVVVMEAKTGRVVAMASNPTYDPNAWARGPSNAGHMMTCALRLSTG